MLYKDVFRQIIIESRGESGLSQEKLAEKSKLSRAYISRLERGINQPNLITLFKVAKGLGVDASDLVSKMQKLIDKHNIELEIEAKNEKKSLRNFVVKK